MAGLVELNTPSRDLVGCEWHKEGVVRGWKGNHPRSVITDGLRLLDASFLESVLVSSDAKEQDAGECISNEYLSQRTDEE